MVVFGNHSSVLVPRQDRERIRAFYCDVLGGTLTQAESARRLAHAKKMLKLSNDELDEMADLARQTHALLNTREPRVAMLKRFLARRSAGGSRALLNALRAVGVAVERIDALSSRLDELA